MQELIVDASAIIAVLLNEPEKATIIESTTNSILLSPPCLPWELGNAFSLALKRSRLNFLQVQKAIEIFQSIPIRYGNVDLISSLQLAGEYNLYAYDAYYLQCAKSFKKPLLTLDRKMTRVAVALKIELLEIQL